MTNQTSLSGFQPPEYQEQCLLDDIIASLRKAVSSKGIDAERLTTKINAAYSVVFLSNFTVFRLRFRGKQHYIALPIMLQDLIPQNAPTKRVKSDPKYIRILVDDTHTAESYADFLIRVAGETVLRYPKEWDCCSRYMECSDAKTCVHPDKGFALACGYKKILASGRVFYGQNRNVD